MQRDIDFEEPAKIPHHLGGRFTASHQLLQQLGPLQRDQRSVFGQQIVCIEPDGAQWLVDLVGQGTHDGR